MLTLASLFFYVSFEFHSRKMIVARKTVVVVVGVANFFLCSHLFSMPFCVTIHKIRKDKANKWREKKMSNGHRKAHTKSIYRMMLANGNHHSKRMSVKEHATYKRIHPIRHKNAQRTHSMLLKYSKAEIPAENNIRSANFSSDYRFRYSYLPRVDFIKSMVNRANFIQNK